MIFFCNSLQRHSEWTALAWLSWWTPVTIHQDSLCRFLSRFSRICTDLWPVLELTIMMVLLSLCLLSPHKNKHFASHKQVGDHWIPLINICVKQGCFLMLPLHMRAHAHTHTCTIHTHTYIQSAACRTSLDVVYLVWNRPSSENPFQFMF